MYNLILHKNLRLYKKRWIVHKATFFYLIKESKDRNVLGYLNDGLSAIEKKFWSTEYIYIFNETSVETEHHSQRLWIVDGIVFP